MTGYVWHPSAEFTERGNLAAFCRAHGVDGGYPALWARSTADPEWFWRRAVADIGIVWHRPPERILDDSGGIAATRWFPGARTNLADSCLDRHVRQGRADAPALRWEREDGRHGELTYGQAADLSARVAGGLRALGVTVGDRVACCLPPGPEAFALLFACARLGALLVPLFSGFGADAIAVRLADAGARVLVTARSTRRHGRVYDLEKVARTAIAAAPDVRHLVVVPEEAPEEAPEERSAEGPAEVPDGPEGLGDWARLAAADPVPALSLDASAPFLLLHTSGTTGPPKGAVHTHGGFAAQVGSETRYHLDLRPDDVVFWVTDPGWIMFPLVLVGTTLAGGCAVAYEGAVDHPDTGRLWRLLDAHRVTVFGSSPSLSRMLRDRAVPSPAAPDRLRILASTGEPWTEEAWRWYFASFGGARRPVINICGGTEVGGSLLASAPDVPQSPCGFAGPCLGIDAVVAGDDGAEVPDGTIGELVVRRPWPGMTQGLWRAPERFRDAYFGRRPGTWSHGDLVSRSGGEWFVHGRADDVIKVAGKRLGPAEAEDAVTADPAVTEAAAVGVPHPVKGETLWCFAVPAPGRALGPADAERLRARVADALGPAFRPARVLPVPELPRTRNGKTMRRLLRALATGAPPGDLSTLVNPGCLDAIRAAVHRTDPQPPP
ncbi:AMP-binding protein [Streptomyces sp. NPDC001595]|uniref:AMP-binding protein n=1 Tax=Streptomyces sp. NPDC001532 TaxID=3154520 RepID=UPI00331D5CCD